MCVLIYVSSCYCMCPHICVLRLLCVSSYMCRHTAMCVSSYYYMCVLILLHVCPHTTTCVSILLYGVLMLAQVLVQEIRLANHWSRRHYQAQKKKLLYMYPNATICVSSYMCPHTTLCPHTSICVLMLVHVRDIRLGERLVPAPLS
jgi:hypothetical protein